MPILVVGDLHGDLDRLELVCEFAERKNIQHLVAVGDCGFANITRGVLEVLSRYNCFVDWIDGNHEDFPYLLSEYGADPHKGNCTIIRGHRMIHVGRGFSSDLYGRKAVFCGGATTPGFYTGTRYPEEVISYADVARSIKHKNCHLLFTHDSAGTANVLHHIRGGVDENCLASRKQIEEIVTTLEPKWHFHGHYHLSYREKFGPTTVIGLACNWDRLMEQVAIYDPVKDEVYRLDDAFNWEP